MFRNAVPFPARRRLLNLIRGKARAEVPAARFPFSQSLDYDLICFSVIDWNYLFQRPQQLVTRFAEAGHRAFYLHTTFHQSGSEAFVRPLGKNVYGVRLPGPSPLNALYAQELSEQDAARMIDALDELRARAAIHRAVCLVQFAGWSRVALAARERWGWPVVYDCIDEISGFRMNHSSVLRREKMLIESADLVTATSGVLYERVSRTARRTLMLPNAADFDHFNRTPDRRPLHGTSLPIIGYYGALSHWLDLEMVDFAARTRPDWQFVLIGDSFDVDLGPLKQLRNVRLLGRQPYRLLPAYLHQFDVACIPFRLTPLTLATNPVKFYEYLAAGKPIVAVDLPELRPYREHFYVARSTEDFVVQIETALNESSEEAARSRVELARQNQWSDRFRTLKESIAGLQ
jgi:glycosyltransferase involved in cell wall biosynthesis